MSLTKKISLQLLAVSLLTTSTQLRPSDPTEKYIEKEKEKSRTFHYDFSSKFKPGDSFYGKNISLLNNNICTDRIFYMRHTLDLNIDVKYGFENPAALLRFQLRNKAVWGSPNVVPTTLNETKLLDYVGQQHRHHIPRHLSWIREAWLEFSINEISDLSFKGKKQTFTLGAFPFQLGRGIALGDAYAVGPDFVGFYSDSTVDQFAFGLKLSGEIIRDKVNYDLYGAILNNKTGSLRDTTEKIFAQQYGRRNNPARGFGIINTVIAGKLFITAFNNPKDGALTLEPYFLVNNDKEQKIEFRGDATSKLATLGTACEFESKRFEFGFDAAINFGRQCVKGWDRNQIETQNRNGELCFVNSHVYVGVDPCSDEAKEVNLSAYKAPQAVIINDPTVANIPGNGYTDVGKEVQNIINCAERDGCLNAKRIGQVDGYAQSTNAPLAQPVNLENILFNAKDRFRNPYKNEYQGWMFVTDGAVFVMDRDLRLAATLGYASGDQDPNYDLKDGNFKAFIPLQELYAGERVKSAFYMGSAGKLSRPLDTPTTEEKIDKFSARVSGFTNLAFFGAGLKWEPHEWKKAFLFNPNILAYWQPWPPKKFDAYAKKDLSCQASTFLGIELNTYVEKLLLKNFKVYMTGALFIPGKHFDDIRGKPLTSAQLKALDKLDRTAYESDIIPNIGDDIAVSFNIAFEYKF